MPGTDINRYILNDNAVNCDPDGYLEELQPWTEKYAVDVALSEGIQLTEEHWGVIQFLRDYFRQHGPANSARHVVEALERRYAVKGGKRYLYTLFPHGPVAQGSRIAGLPLPAYTSDPGFGSSK